MDTVGYAAAPAPIRERIDSYMLDRYEQLDETTAAAIDAALTLTNGPMLRARARSRQRRGQQAPKLDTRSLAVDVMLPDLADRTWRVWFTVRLRGPYIRDMLAMFNLPAPDDLSSLDGPQEGTQGR